MDIFKSIGSVDGVDAVGPWFRPGYLVAKLAAHVAKLSKGGHVLLIGGSMGGPLAILAVARLFDDSLFRDGADWDSKNVSILLLDPPSGAESLKKLETAPAWVADLIGSKGRRLPPRLFNRGPLNAEFQRRFCSGISDDVPIELPEGIDPDSDEADQYREEVRQACYDGQQGFEPTLAIGELAWMCDEAAKDAVMHACARIDGRIHVTHLACTGDNEVIINPLAKSFYVYSLPNANFQEFDTNHLDFEQFAPSWRNCMTMLLTGN